MHLNDHNISLAALIRSHVLVKATEIALILLVAFQVYILVIGVIQKPGSELTPIDLNAITRQTQNNTITPENTLNHFHLFGKESATKARKQETVTQSGHVPETRLKIKITGLMAHTDDTKALAILDSGGKQKILRIGETIQNTQAEVYAIYSDRVVIRHRGQQEAIYLYPNHKNRPNPQQTQQLAKQPTRSGDKPLSLDEVIALSSVQKNQQIIGYRLTPKGFSEYFQEAGLQANDLVVAIDDYDLTNTNDAEEIISELEYTEEATFTVQREGQLHNFELSI